MGGTRILINGSGFSLIST